MSTNSAPVTPGLFDVAGKVCLVTGGSRGIGLAIARGLVQAGARVYICARDAAQCSATAAELSEFGECNAFQADLSSLDGCRTLAEQMQSVEDDLHVLVNNAGANRAHAFVDFPEDTWDTVMDVNLKSTFFLTQALLPLLQSAASQDDPARVINVGSIRGYLVPSQPTFAYTASKGAVQQLSRHLASQFAPIGITVNVLAPGIYQTRMGQAGTPLVEGRVPLGRPADPDDIAGAAIFLASRAGAYLTGTVIPVDGGLSIAAS